VLPVLSGWGIPVVAVTAHPVWGSIVGDSFNFRVILAPYP